MHVLIADQEIDHTIFLQKTLKAHNITADITLNGKEIVSKAESSPYDLIIMETAFPQKNGIAVIQELRRKNQITPILCLSSRDSIEDIAAGLNAGCDGYMTKPLEIKELISRVNALVRRASQQRATELVFADLRLDLISRKLWHKDNEINLSEKEYSLFELFMYNPNQTLSRSMIDKHVWGFIDNFSNRVNVHVWYLRNKIERISESKLFHAVRGVGYVLRLED